MCSLMMSPCSRDVITILSMAVDSKAPGFWMVEHQLVNNVHIVWNVHNNITMSSDLTSLEILLHLLGIKFEDE